MDALERYSQQLKELREKVEKVAEALKASVARRREFNRRMAEKLGISLDEPNPDDTKG